MRFYKDKPNERNRIVITGVGVVSSLGNTKNDFWKNLKAGKSGIRQISIFDTSQHDRHFAGEIKNFKPEDYMPKQRLQYFGRTSQMTLAASKLALKDGGLALKKVRGQKVGVCIGTTMGEPRVMEFFDETHYQKDDSFRLDKVTAFSYPSSAIVHHITNEFKFKAPSLVFSTACAAGNYAITHSMNLIRQGKAEMMLAGGADALSRVAFTGFGRLFAMAPEKCQPFDRNRKGMLVGEGAAVVLLESLKHARKRNASIYAEIAGYGLSCDANHMTNPSQKGIEKAIRRCLENAQMKPEQVDYISAHGTGTKENDRAECKVIKNIFNGRSKTIPMSSIKSMLGHTMGAASTFETIACCMAIKEGVVPPTINFKEKDPDCDIDCVPNKGKRHEVKAALNNSQAFGGNNACIILSKL